MDEITRDKDGRPVWPITAAGWCKWFRRLDADYNTMPGSPLHHDQRCPLYCQVCKDHGGHVVGCPNMDKEV